MVKSLTFGYRFEGMLLHEWAHRKTEHLGLVLPANREAMSRGIINWAKFKNISVYIQRGKDDLFFIEDMRQLNPDIILVHCYTYRLVPDILKVPRLGCINLHPGKLPKYRGKDPIEEAKQHGDLELTATLHYMDKDYDTGPIISQRTVPYPQVPNRRLVSLAMTNIGLQLLESLWPQISNGTAPRMPQDG